VVADHPGVPQLRTLREIMVQVYTLFDRRCRTQTALDNWPNCGVASSASPRWVRRSRSSFPHAGESPDVSRRQTAASTSNAVERGNRRYRKMQKQVYRVRTQYRSVPAWPWICGVKPKPKAVTNPHLTPSGTGWISPCLYYSLRILYLNSRKSRRRLPHGGIGRRTFFSYLAQVRQQEQVKASS